MNPIVAALKEFLETELAGRNYTVAVNLDGALNATLTNPRLAAMVAGNGSSDRHWLPPVFYIVATPRKLYIQPNGGLNYRESPIGFAPAHLGIPGGIVRLGWSQPTGRLQLIIERDQSEPPAIGYNHTKGWPSTAAANRALQAARRHKHKHTKWEEVEQYATPELQADLNDPEVFNQLTAYLRQYADRLSTFTPETPNAATPIS